MTAASLSLAGCKPAAARHPLSRQHVDAYTEAQRRQWLAGTSGPCGLIGNSMRHLAGERGRDCSKGRSRINAIACAKRAFDRMQPFTLCDSGWGMDSYIENGVAGLPNGNIVVYYFDTFGPQYRATCLRPSVSFARDDWPRCKRAFADEIDLRTGRLLVPMKTPNEEGWPQSCAASAMRAPRWSIGVHLISGSDPLPDPQRWGLSCRQATASFEMLIDETGHVQCVRIISVGRGRTVPGLYDSIRSHLLQWRFESPLLHGEPIEVRWGMTTMPLLRGETLPGPPIYHVCH